jgi:hypothetical protein
VAPHEAPKTTNKDPWDADHPSDEPSTVEPDETPAPAPKAPAPASGAITCEAVALRAAELIGQAAVEKAKSMSPDEVENLKAKLETELPAAIEQLLSQCAKENWSQTSRACVINATTLEQATKCQ